MYCFLTKPQQLLHPSLTHRAPPLTRQRCLLRHRASPAINLPMLSQPNPMRTVIKDMPPPPPIGLTIRGSGPFIPSIFFSDAPFFPFFFCSDGNRGNRGIGEHPKTDRRQTKRRTKRGPFFAKMMIPPPHRHNFSIDLQQRWTINWRTGNRQCTYYLIVRALTVAVLLFFL